MMVFVLFLADRLFGVAEQGDEAPRGRRSKWLWRTATVGIIGVIAVAFLAALPVVLDLSGIDGKVDQVRAGKRLTYDLLDPFQLAKPRADLVDERWVAADPPPPFTTRSFRPLTYLGQNSGTSVFLDTRRTPAAVYRVPTSAVAFKSLAVSILP